MKRLCFLVFLLAGLSSAQLVRFSQQFPSITSVGGTPYLVANVPPNSPKIAVCSSPANGLPCTNYATTYTSSGAVCPSGAQDTPDPQPSACQTFGDAQGNIGFWANAGQYDYTVCVGINCYGPFTITLGGAGGGGGSGCGVNPADGGCTIAGSPSVDLFIGTVGGGTGWLFQLLSTALNLKVPLNITGSNAGAISLGFNPDPGLGSGVALVAPASGTPYNFYWPQTAGSGFLRGSNAANKVTNVFQASIDLSADVGTTILPVANGGTGNSTPSGALINLFPTIIRNGDLICAAGGVWNTCPNTGGNTGTPAFFTENSGGTPGWVQVPIPPIDGGTGLTTLTLNTVYKGNGVGGMLPSSMVDVGQFAKLRCDSGLGDGLNAMTAGTYLQSFCYNDSGVTWTITGIKCFTDNSGTSTLNATNGAGTGLLTGAVTCTTAFAAGTQSGTTTIAAGDFIKFTFAADGTSKQSTWVVSLTQ